MFCLEPLPACDYVVSRTTTCLYVVSVYFCRLRDLSAQDKSEYQQVVKDLEKQSGVANQLMEQKARLQEELQEAENIIDELKEQVDASLGAEEMVETLTEKKLDLEEKVTELQEQVDDLVRTVSALPVAVNGGSLVCVSLYRKP